MTGNYFSLYRLDVTLLLDNGGGPLLGLYTHLASMARFTAGLHDGVWLERGQLKTSYRDLAKETKLSLKQVRNGIKKLEKLAMISAQQRAHRLTIITLLKICEDVIIETEEGHTKGHTKGHSEGTVRAHRGHSDLAKPLLEGGLEPPNNGRMEEGNNKYPRAKVLGDLISDLYHKKTGHVFKPKGKMQKDIRDYLADGKIEEEIMAAYTAFLEEPAPYFKDRAWNKFGNWWVAHPRERNVQTEQQYGLKRTR